MADLVLVRRRDSGIVTMQPSRIFETVLYAEDLAAAERFYHEALGLEVIGRGELSVVFRCGGGVLLVFDPRKSAAPDRDVPSHGTTGAGHVAFAVKPEDLAPPKKGKKVNTKELQEQLKGPMKDWGKWGQRNIWNIMI